jgi:histidinol-phosphate/aromatic aminotransferase/cobyric acid decarboxylase-like protein
VPEDCLLPGAGSSDLLFLAFHRWMSPGARALVLDPTYGEYVHLLERVLGCRVDRLPCRPDRGFAVDPVELRAALRRGYDLVALVNPNSPTGRHLNAELLQDLLADLPSQTRVWLDETYVDYVIGGWSLEAFAAASEQVVVCKSMSKAYGLSGVRVAYLCGPARLMADLRHHLPPWAVSLPGQVAAVQALADPDYYAGRYRETSLLRQRLAEELPRLLPMTVIPGEANFLFCLLDPAGPDAASVVNACLSHGLYLRDASSMGAGLGRHALRVAVKDAATNERMLRIIAAATVGLHPRA